MHLKIFFLYLNSQKHKLLLDSETNLSVFDIISIIHYVSFIITITVFVSGVVVRLSGRTSVSDRTTFPGLHLTCS